MLRKQVVKLPNEHNDVVDESGGDAVLDAPLEDGEFVLVVSVGLALQEAQIFDEGEVEGRDLDDFVQVFVKDIGLRQIDLLVPEMLHLVLDYVGRENGCLLTKVVVKERVLQEVFFSDVVLQGLEGKFLEALLTNSEHLLLDVVQVVAVGDEVLVELVADNIDEEGSLDYVQGEIQWVFFSGFVHHHYQLVLQFLYQILVVESVHYLVEDLDDDVEPLDPVHADDQLLENHLFEEQVTQELLGLMGGHNEQFVVQKLASDFLSNL